MLSESLASRKKGTRHDTADLRCGHSGHSGESRWRGPVTGRCALAERLLRKLQDAPLGVGHELDGVVYANGLTSFGYVRVIATATSVTTTFVRTQGTHRQVFETVQIDLQSGQPTHPPA